MYHCFYIPIQRNEGNNITTAGDIRNATFNANLLQLIIRKGTKSRLLKLPLLKLHNTLNSIDFLIFGVT